MTAESVINRIREAIENTPIYNEQIGGYVNVTISIGVTQLIAGQNVDNVLDKADKALYQAKLTRNTVCLNR